ncbi:MAG: 50S ribosomal protein L13 [Candidatus Paceibacterota bacterium]
MEYKIDAENKKIGRMSSEIATILMGKNTPDFEKHKVAGNTVVVMNASKLAIDDKKLEEKEYERYSGYPGGLKIDSLARLIEKKGHGEVIRNAVYGMLPANKLRPRLMKNLIIND